MKNRILLRTLIILMIFSILTAFRAMTDNSEFNAHSGLCWRAEAKKVEKQEIVDKEEVKEDLAVEKIEEKQPKKLEQILRTPKTTIVVFAVVLQVLAASIICIVIVNVVKKRKYYKSLNELE